MTIKTGFTTKKILSGIVAATMLITFYSCGKKHTAAKTEQPPATQSVATADATIPAIPVENKGQVQIKRDISGNYVIHINLRELEAVNKLDATSKKAYIVWMNANNEKAKNLGQINSNTGWLSDKSKASFEAVSVIKPTKVYITEEDITDAKTPGKNIIWTTNNF